LSDFFGKPPLEGVIHVMPVRSFLQATRFANNRGCFFFNDAGNPGLIFRLRTARLNCSKYLFFKGDVRRDRIEGRQIRVIIAFAALEPLERFLRREWNDQPAAALHLQAAQVLDECPGIVEQGSFVPEFQWLSSLSAPSIARPVLISPMNRITNNLLVPPTRWSRSRAVVD
jgi:hypothetical protein